MDRYLFGKKGAFCISLPQNSIFSPEYIQRSRGVLTTKSVSGADDR